MKPGRNDPCPCGSGGEFNQCCNAKFEARLVVQSVPTKGGAPTPTERSQLVALLNAGRNVELESQARLLIKQYPDSGFTWKLLGASLQMQGKEALPALQKATELLPDDVEAHYNLGNTLRGLGQLNTAVASYHRALEIKPDLAEAHNNLGITLQDLGQLDLAIESYRRALKIKPDYAEAHYNLGIALRDLGQLDLAIESYRRALKIKPDFAEAHNNLGIVLHDLGQLDAAVASFRQALRIKPTSLRYAIHTHLLLPIIPETLDTVAAWRERYQTGIAALMDTPGTLEEPGTNVNPSLFYLPYNNYNDRTVMEALCRLFRQILPDSTATSPYVTGWSPPTTRGQRIRVGFLSEFLVNHTIGKLYQGFIRYLDRTRFEVVVIHTPKAKRDSFSQSLDALADKVLTLPTRLKGQQQTMMAEKLDVLFYPDIGMTPATYFLAYTRLAPVQAVGWGHPDTTGLDSIDYFVSAATIEPENAEEHYTERLIRLNRIPCYYQALMASTQIPNRLAMGLPETGTLYGCPQSLFKFHPDFDHVLATIAEGDPAGYIVLLEGKRSAWGELLTARWAKTFPILLERVLFLPRMPLERFTAFMSHMDILLDPIHFGSGNTFYEAMVYGTPVVTWPGQFMRGRIVAGAYRQMGIVDAPIALRLEDYAPLALALGRDPERRRALRQASREAANRELFADMQAVKEFEDFLVDAVAAAGRGEKLPTGWRPNFMAQQTQHKITVGTELNPHVYPEKMVQNNHCLPQEDAVEVSQENLSPALFAYHQNVLAMRQSSTINYPAHVHLETMAKCNAACSFCPYPTLDRQGAVMEDELIEKVVNDLCDIPRLHTFQLSPFKVNEPFLDNRLIDLLALFNTRLPNACITLTSNASPITEKKLAQLAAFSRIGYLWISFNDHRKVEYEQSMQLPYERTIERLEMIHKAKADQRLSIRVVLSRVSDGSSADREFAVWVKTRFPLFDVSLLPRGGWIGQVNGPANSPPAVGCSRWFDVSITATGVVAHCCMDGKAEFPIGNVRHEHVLEIYNKADFRRLRAKLNTRLEADPCRRCGFL